MIIYLITNLVNGKVYVGQTRQKLYKRWAGHRGDAKLGNKFPICAAIRKYGPKSFSIEPIATVETQEWADYLERIWIVLKDSRNPKVGYNIRVGGNSSPIPESTRKSLLISVTGRKHSDETKKLIGEASKKAWLDGRLRGLPHTEQGRENISKAKSLDKHNKWIKLNNELLVFLYNNRVPTDKIAEHFGVNSKTIAKHIQFTQLPTIGRQKKYLDEDLLVTLYKEDTPMSEICSQMGCTFITIQKRVRALGLTRNQDRWQSFRNQSEIPMSQ